MVDKELKAVSSDEQKEVRPYSSSSSHHDLGTDGVLHQSIVIENLTYPYVRPSVLDVKLGTVMHEPDATEEKIERMTASAKSTTSHEMGLRLTGFRVSLE
jgi:hypothetical protein